MAQGSVWSIAIYTGTSPLCTSPAPGIRTPVLTAENVHHTNASFVADPFMVQHDGLWHLFCEVKKERIRDAEIGLATSADGLHWEWQGPVLAEPFHLSYPLVFESDGEYYMTPETLARQAVILYRATRFPDRWEPVAKLVDGVLADPTPFQFNGRWYLYACGTPHQHDSLRLYHADSLLGPWEEHPCSPLITDDKTQTRPGGRTIVWEGAPIRFAQDCVPVYGTRVRAFRVSELTADRYAEAEVPESPILFPDAEWNATGMHHIDPHLVDGKWIACVDGYVYIE